MTDEREAMLDAIQVGLGGAGIAFEQPDGSALEVQKARSGFTGKVGPPVTQPTTLPDGTPFSPEDNARFDMLQRRFSGAGVIFESKTGERVTLRNPRPGAVESVVVKHDGTVETVGAPKPAPPTRPMIRDASRRIREVLRSLIATQPFFGHLALRLPLREDTSRKTVASDGEIIRYNPSWVLEQPSDKIRSAISHCVLACALHHHTRRGERKYERWQRASREATLPYLREAGLTTTEGGENDTVERIYDRLPDENDDDNKDDNQSPPGASPGEGDGGGPPSSDPNGRGEVMDAPVSEDPAEAEAERREIEQKWDEARQQAAQASKAAGVTPGSILALIEESHRHRVDWREELRRFLTAVAATDYTWSRPNRRHIASGLYLPALHSDRVGPIVLAVDTSGSMDDVALQHVWTEIRGLARDANPENVTVVQCDSKVQRIDHYAVEEMPESLETVGRGGTAYAPAFEAVEDMPQRPAVVLYFTDLHCYDIGTNPGVPVLWVVQPGGAKDKPMPFGETIYIPGESDR